MKARRGQILVFFALLLPFLVLILLGALEAAADVLRVQETMAAATSRPTRASRPPW